MNPWPMEFEVLQELLNAYHEAFLEMAKANPGTIECHRFALWTTCVRAAELQKEGKIKI